MKLDELAFVNQQLAGMLRAGLPLEGALRQVCESMRRDPLRAELQALEEDLRQGLPLGEALDRRQLPSFYRQMLTLGAQGHDLPGVLTLLADYYRRGHNLWTRLKGLLVYPLMVLCAWLGLSVLVAVVFGRLLGALGLDAEVLWGTAGSGPLSSWWFTVQLWLPVVLVAVMLGLVVLVLLVPAWRRSWCWRIPAFKEAKLSQLASALALMLQQGCSLNDALALARQLEKDTPAGAELDRWLTRLADGHTRFSDLVSGHRFTPPLFTWLVAGSGEDWAGGFRHAAEIYYERTLHRAEMFLYAVLPVSVLVLGLMILLQVWPLTRETAFLFSGVGDVGGGQ